jgi:hypothetical protein
MPYATIIDGIEINVDPKRHVITTNPVQPIRGKLSYVAFTPAQWEWLVETLTQSV